MIENLEIYLSVAITVFSLFASALTFLIKLIKNIKERIKTENKLKISEYIIPLIEEAEAFVNYTGIEKKEFVTTRITQFALSNKIKLDQEMVSEIIEKLVSLTKNVNIISKDSKLKSILCGKE